VAFSSLILEKPNAQCNGKAIAAEKKNQMILVFNFKW
jgi:hypothetical protein